MTVHSSSDEPYAALPVVSGRPAVGAEAPKLAADEAREYQKMSPCIHCGGWHLRSCPRVKKATFNGDGKPVEVEYWAHGEWPDDNIVWPETVAEVLADD